MKILVIILSLITIVFTEECWTVRCKNLKLETEKPLHLNETVEPGTCYKEVCLNKPFRKLELKNVKGSIGIKTFSLMPHIEELKITYSDISSIEAGALCALPNLKTLSIELNQEFPTLTDTVFNNCQHLKDLTIETAQINQNAYKNLVGLEVLRIGYQNISHFTKDYLNPLTNLKSFSMFISSVDKIDNGAFCVPPKLETLSLAAVKLSSPITNLTFENCGNVKDFSFIRHRNASIADEAFSAFTNAKTVYLSILPVDDSNFLKKAYLKGFENAEELVISDSDVMGIRNDTFSDFSNLRSLSLWSNSLTELDSNTIKPLANLKKLELNLNRLTTIDYIIHPTLEVLSVKYNCISKVNTTAIKANLPNLKELDLSCNLIKSEVGKDIQRGLEGVSVSYTRYPFDEENCSGRTCSLNSYLFIN